MFEAFNGLQAFVQLSLLDEVSKPLRNVENSIKQFSNKSIKELNKVERAFKGVVDASNKLFSAGKKLAVFGGAVIGSTVPFIWQGAEFERGIAEVSTLVDMELSQFQAKYQSKLLEIARTLGQDTDAVIKAYYDAISSGFDPDKALGLIRQAGKAAIAGVSDIATANDTLITVLNNWKQLDLSKASDLIFKTIKFGKTTFNEIASSIGDVAPILSSVGVSFEEFSAIIATATAKGLKTGSAMTSLREIVQSLVFPTNQAQEAFAKLGITINRETLQSKGVIGTLTEIIAKMKAQGMTVAQIDQMISQIFGSVEAKKIIMQVMADPKAFEEAVKNFKTTNNETQKAFEKMSQTASFQLSVLMQNLKAFAISIGTILIPPFIWIIGKINAGISAITGFIEKHQTLAKVVILPAVAVGGLLFVIGTLISVLGLLGLAVSKGIISFFEFRHQLIATKSALSQLPANLKILRGQLLLTNLSVKGLITSFNRLLVASLRFAFSPVGIGLMALSLTIYAVMGSLDSLKGGFNNTFGFLKTAYASYIEPFIEGFKIGLIHLSGAFKPIEEAVKPLKEAFALLFSTIFGGFKQAVFSNQAFLDSVEAGVLIGKAFAVVIKTALEGLAFFIKPIVAGLTLIVKVFTWIAEKLKVVYSWFTQLPEPVKFLVITAMSLAVPIIGFVRVLKLALLPLRLIIGLFTGIKGKITAITFAVSLIGQAFSWLYNQVVNIWQKIINFLNSFNLFEIGKNIVKGLVGGIKQGFNEAVETIKGVGTGIINKFKGIFGINSPSRVFEGFGLNILQGLKVGIIGNLQIAKESLSIFDKLVPQDIKLKVSNIIDTVFSPQPQQAGSIIPKIEKPVNKTVNNATSSKIINIPKIVINYTGNEPAETVGKEVANQIVMNIEEFLERL